MKREQRTVGLLLTLVTFLGLWYVATETKGIESVGASLGLGVSSMDSGPVAYTVTYSVTSTEPKSFAAVTMYNQSGGMDQIVVQVPWTLTFRAQPGQLVSVLAQKKGERGVLEAEIAVNGVQIQHAMASEHYGIAHVNGIVK